MTDLDADVAVSATGPLRELSRLGVLTWADVHPAQHLTHLFAESDERVRLAVALTVRALRAGSICLPWSHVTDLGFGEDPDAAVPESFWPERGAWLEALRASPAVTVGDGADGPSRPLRFADGALYLERHWADQESVRRHLLARLAGAPRAQAAPPAPDEAQHAAVALAASSPVSVIAGGPGTGKTWTIAHLIDTLRAREPGLLVGLAAPTGKAAARMSQSLGGGQSAVTLHALLGWKPGSRTRFVHDAANPLPHDVVVVDELSMVSMTLMARLLEALKPSARLVLVGDPDQLASVDAGSVLADITRGQAARPVVTELTRNHRFSGAIRTLADAVRAGDADAALAALTGDDPAVRLLGVEAGASVLRSRCVAAGTASFRAASALDPVGAVAALDRHRLLCGHRRGAFGVTHWTRTVQGWLAADVPGYRPDGEFYAGRPVMMTRNAPDFGLHNGDAGVVIVHPDGPRAWFGGVGSGLRSWSPFLLDGLVSVYAMTVHKAQGSQFDDVSLVLPPAGSPLLTRELLYTAVTRATSSVLVLGEPDAVREAIARPARRVSGLAERLR